MKEKEEIERSKQETEASKVMPHQIAILFYSMLIVYFLL